MITDATILVAPTIAVRQRLEEKASAADTTSSVTPTGESEVTRPDADAKPEERPIRIDLFFGAVHLDSERYGRDFNRVAQEILQHLAATPSTDMEITLEIRAKASDGFDEAKVRVVSENARTLKFDTFGFETE